MTYIVDIDDTLLKSDKAECRVCGRVKYIDAKPILEEVIYLRMLYYSGHTIILHTGRNWDCYSVTVQQLAEYEIPYHQLVMGKPQGIYIDADSKTTLAGEI